MNCYYVFPPKDFSTWKIELIHYFNCTDRIPDELPVGIAKIEALDLDNQRTRGFAEFFRIMQSTFNLEM